MFFPVQETKGHFALNLNAARQYCRGSVGFVDGPIALLKYNILNIQTLLVWRNVCFTWVKQRLTQTGKEVMLREADSNRDVRGRGPMQTPLSMLKVEAWPAMWKTEKRLSKYFSIILKGEY